MISSYLEYLENMNEIEEWEFEDMAYENMLREEEEKREFFEDLYRKIFKKYKHNRHIKFNDQEVCLTTDLIIRSKNGKAKLTIIPKLENTIKTCEIILFDDQDQRLIFPTPNNIYNEKCVVKEIDTELYANINYIINYWCKYKKHMDKQIIKHIQKFNKYKAIKQKIINHINNKYNDAQIYGKATRNCIMNDFGFTLKINNSLETIYDITYSKSDDSLISIKIISHRDSNTNLNDQIISGRTNYYNVEEAINDIDIIYNKCSNLLLNDNGMMEYVKNTHLKLLKKPDFNPCVFNMLQTEYHKEYISTTFLIKTTSDDKVSLTIINYYDNINHYTITKNINGNLIEEFKIDYVKSIDDNINIIFTREIKIVYNLQAGISDLSQLFFNKYNQKCKKNIIVTRCLEIFNAFIWSLCIRIKNMNINFVPCFVPEIFGYLEVYCDEDNDNNIPIQFRNYNYVKINDIQDLFDQIDFIKNYSTFKKHKNYVALHDAIINHMNENIIEDTSNVLQFISEPYWIKELMSYI